MDEWMNGWMDEGMIERRSEGTIEFLDDWVD
jgi:hypothetical protein